eukprot:3396883-Alexandrium_andersonii.AAC.1
MLGRSLRRFRAVSGLARNRPKAPLPSAGGYRKCPRLPESVRKCQAWLETAGGASRGVRGD